MLQQEATPDDTPTIDELTHHLRDAFTATRGYLELLANRCDACESNDEFRRIFDRIRADLASLDEIVDKRFKVKTEPHQPPA